LHGVVREKDGRRAGIANVLALLCTPVAMKILPHKKAAGRWRPAASKVGV
jgi:hypothetical protein